MITTSSIPSLLTNRKGNHRSKQKTGGHSAYSDWIRLSGLEDEKKPKKSLKTSGYHKSPFRSKGNTSKNKE